ncbi:cell division protein ZapA [Gammaproteobacteria bacterium]
MSEALVAVTIQILDKDYKIACRESEQESLRTSARFLDTRMREIRNTGKVIGVDRLAVMAALNITHEYLSQKKAHTDQDDRLRQRFLEMRSKLSAAAPARHGSSEEDPIIKSPPPLSNT